MVKALPNPTFVGRLEKNVREKQGGINSISLKVSGTSGNFALKLERQPWGCWGPALYAEAVGNHLACM